MAIGVRQDEEFSGTKPVEEHHRFDEAWLDAWTRRNVNRYEGRLVVNQFKGGQSNLTCVRTYPTTHNG
jgi:aminoglycoside phosphotransferase (APT) family kinase protein